MTDRDLLPLLLLWIDSDDVEPPSYEDYRKLVDAGLLDDERRVPEERAWPTPKAVRLIVQSFRDDRQERDRRDLSPHTAATHLRRCGDTLMCDKRTLSHY